MPTPRAFIAIEQTMAASMKAEWDRLARGIMGQLHACLEQGQWQDAHALADQLTMTGVVSNVRPKIEQLAVSSILYGAHHVRGSVKETSYMNGEAIPVEMQSAIDQLVLMVEQDASDYVRNQLHEEIKALAQQDVTTHFQKDDISDPQLAETGGLQEPEQAEARKKKAKKAEKSLAEKLNDAVLSGGKVAIDASANLTTSRLVTLGFLAEAQKTGVDTYQVNEVLDSRTCPVCRYMNGKRFSVAHEYGRVMQALSTSDPQDLKSIAPRPRQSKAGMQDLYNMSLGELQSSGYGSPPYHPGCRGLLSLEGTVEEEIPVGAAAQQPRVTGLQMPNFAALGVTPEPAVAASPEAQATEEQEGGWSEADIDRLAWARFEVTDPATFKLVDDAFEAAEYGKAQKLIDKWKTRQAATKEDEFEGPNQAKKKRKRQAPAGLEQDYNDIKPDSSSIAFDDGLSPAGFSDDAEAPIDRN